MDRNHLCAAVWAELGQVVPRKGDVDRNAGAGMQREGRIVVPRKGDVDRNFSHTVGGVKAGRRPPQGGRG